MQHNSGVGSLTGPASLNRYRDRLATELEPLVSAAGANVSWHAVDFSGENPFAAFVDRLPGDMRLVSQKRITEYLAGRYCARRALVDADARGSQWLPRGHDRLPIWPPGWIGSISHADGIAAAAVVACTPGRVLGLDVERWIEPHHAAQIGHLIAGAVELDMLAILPPERAVTVLFSAKEALFKALYPQARRFMDFSAARLVAVSDGELIFQLCERWSEDWGQDAVVSVRFLLMDTHVFTLVATESGSGAAEGSTPTVFRSR
jgi:enterobactin synthetase component D